MDRVIINNVKELSDIMFAIADDQESLVTSVLFYEDTAELVKELLKNENVFIGNIELTSEDFNGYDKEYYVSLDSDLILNVEPAYKELDDGGCYTYENSDIAFYGEDTNSKIAINSDNKHKYELRIDGSGMDIDEFAKWDCRCHYYHRGFSGLTKLMDFIFDF